MLGGIGTWGPRAHHIPVTFLLHLEEPAPERPGELPRAKYGQELKEGG
jgi:hypothetical protein